MTDPDMVIAARDVTLTLGDTAVLRGVDLSVARGESVALLGASGSGKSSLMAVLTGLERASGGHVVVDGLDISALDEDALARARRGRIGICKLGRAARRRRCVCTCAIAACGRRRRNSRARIAVCEIVRRDVGVECVGRERGEVEQRGRLDCESRGA